MRDELISRLRLKYRDYHNLSGQALGNSVTEILAKMAGGVIKTHYKKMELMQRGGSEASEDEAIMEFTSSNIINKSMPIYKEQADKAIEQKEETHELQKKRRKPEDSPKSNKSTNEKTKGVKKKKVEESKGHLIESTITFKDLGGIDDIIEDIKETIEWPLKYIKVYNYLGIQPPRGILLCGPSGCGKTTLAMAICGEFKVPFFKISGPEIVSGMSGESELKIRQLFREVTEAAPAILFVDEIDSIAGKRETAFKDMEKRIVAQFLTCIDDLNSMADAERPVIIIGATNRPEHIDVALRRAGRFDREISIGVPNEGAREHILKKQCAKLRLSKDCDFLEIARMTPGYVGADLASLVKEAAISGIKRILTSLKGMEGNISELSEEQLKAVCIEKHDFEVAAKIVQPTIKREGFTTVPDVTWDNVGALASIRDELEMSILKPIKFPELFNKIGLTAPSGVLLYGPPGCGKTLVAKAVSNESKANFISIKGPELLNKYVGESEKAIRQLFHRARISAPCIVFFDEMDALCPKRGLESNSATERVVNQLLTELDGLESRKNVFVIAATNRPDIIDPAMLRPGRLDKLLYVPLPTKEDRYSILFTQCKGRPIAEDVDIKGIAEDERCDVMF